MHDGDRKEHRVFLSHASEDKPDVQRLRVALADRGIGAWEDVLELRLGGTADDIRDAIVGADGFVLLLTPSSIGSEWVQREVAWAREAKVLSPGYALLPIVRGLPRPALKLLFGEAEPFSHLLGDDDPIEDAVPAIVQALGLAPQNATPRPDPVPAPPMAELVLKLRKPRIHEEAGTRRAAAEAEVLYTPVGGGRGVDGPPADFTAPLGPIEAADLRWYLEAYGIWPFGTFKDRAQAIEASLPRWGRMLFDAVLARPEARPAFEAWRSAPGVERRITIFVDDRGPDETRPARAEAAAMLLALPWEILADPAGHYLFEGAFSARVRRALPSDHALAPAEPSLPLRILLVLARPDDERAAFLDPRVSALPLAEALEPLGESVALTVLGNGTLGALREALDAAEKAGRPFQVVHFDGHGVYDERLGLGRLCFENAADAAEGKLERRAELVDAGEIGGLLLARRVPLFVLEACQTAMTEKSPTASVAAELLKVGVASVVAMSHAVYVETARRFVGAFYRALAEGERIGTAMVRAQHALKDDRARGEMGGAPFLMSDWMVPVLFQEAADVPLFPGGVDLREASKEDRRRKAKVLRGELPEPPAHGFVGRARALLAVDRLIDRNRVVALVGGGGQGKTALAVEAARWLLAMRRVDRVAFVSVETVSEARAVLDAIGRQLVPGYVVGAVEGGGSEEEKRRRALLPVEGVLQERRVLVVVDNLESVLPRVGEEMEEGTRELLGMVRGMGEVGRTRVLVTSREVPREMGGGVLNLPALGTREGMELLAGVLKAKGMEPPRAEHEKEAVAGLVEAVGGHARSLVLLGGLVAEKGVEAVARDVRGMMAELEERWPGVRERSLIASVRLSLRRLPEGVREKIRGLAVFHGAAHFAAMAYVLQVKEDEALDLCRMLVAVGLADADGPYLLPDPGLGVVLSLELTTDEWEEAEFRWLLTTMRLVAGLLHRTAGSTVASALREARMALSNMLAALTRLEQDVAVEQSYATAATGYATELEELVRNLGLPGVSTRIADARRRLSERLVTWSHARFVAGAAEVDRRHDAGDFSGALEAARSLDELTESAGDAYPEAAVDRAMACFKMGRMLRECGSPEEALHMLEEARSRSSLLGETGLESAAITDKGDALRDLGRLDEAATAYEDAVRCCVAAGDVRGAAIARAQLGTVYYNQLRLDDARACYSEAKDTFEALGEPKKVAVAWHQLGIVCAEMDDVEAAEHAYKTSLSLRVAHADRVGEGRTLHQLATLYGNQDRFEDALTLYRQAAAVGAALGNKLDEGRSLRGVGIAFSKLRRLDDAREALIAARAVEKSLGHTAEPWRTWVALEAVERDAGQPRAALEARQEALRTYRAYRAEGGDPKDPSTRFIAAFGQTLRASGPDEARALLPDPANVPDWFAPTLRALQAIAAGRRDPALADDPSHNPLNAVELALLLETAPPPPTPPPANLAADAPCPCGSGKPFPLCHGAAEPDGT